MNDYSRRPQLSLLGGTSVVALLLGSVSPAFAQSAGDTTSATVGEVVVTANKRTERLTDVPASVTAIGSATFQTLNAVRFEDYIAQIPGLTLAVETGGNGFDQLSIRGITTGRGGNPTVGIYIDDAPFGSTVGPFAADHIPDIDPQDLSRVEVLKGPQGTLYGGGSLGGLIKFVTAQPDPSHFFGRAEVDGSDVDGGGLGYGVRGAANVPITDKLALRVSAYDREDPGFINNVATGARDVNGAHFYGGRAALGWQVNANWRVTLSALIQQQISGGSSTGDFNTQTFQPIYGKLDESRNPGTGQSKATNAAVDLHIDGNLGWATLTSSTSYNDQPFQSNLDESTNFNLPGVGAAAITSEGLAKVSQELRLASPATNVISWQVGGFYTYENSYGHQTLPTISLTTGEPLPGGLLLETLRADEIFQEYAFFGDATYRPNAFFDISAGLRYSHDTISLAEGAIGALVGAPKNLVAGSVDGDVTFLVTPQIHLDKNNMIYLRVASGFRPGGPNIAVPGSFASYQPDTVVNYEAGYKADLFEKRISIDLSAYYINWNNIQLNEASPLGFNYIGNAGAAISKGAEVSAVWNPIRGLSISGNLAYTLAQLTAVLPAGGGLVGFPGDRLPDSPRWSGALNADYEFPMTALAGGFRGLVGATYSYVGDREGQFPTSTTIPRFPLPYYQTGDLRLGVRKDQFTGLFFVKNVGNDIGLVDNVRLGSSTRVSVTQPRTFGFSLSRSF